MSIPIRGGSNDGVPIGAIVAEHGAKTAEELESPRITVRTAGRILAIRGFGKAGFLQLSDGMARVQVYVRQDSVSAHDYSVFKLLDLGDFVGVEGYLFRTRTNEFSVHVTSLTFLVEVSAAAAGEVARTAGYRDALPAAVSRSDREPGLAACVRGTQPCGDGVS